MPKASEKRVAITVAEHRDTHLLVAYSKDLPGLTVAARSHAQLEREIPGAIREILEAEGKHVLSVEIEPSDETPDSFVRNSMIASARVAGSTF